MYFYLLRMLMRNSLLIMVVFLSTIFCVCFAENGLTVEQPLGACGDCHSDWPLSQQNSNSFSPTVRLNKQSMCIDCHSNAEIAAKFKLPSRSFIQSFQKSAHGKDTSITCYDCHQTCLHGFKSGVPETSLRKKINVPKTCGRCHAEVLDAYQESIHGTAITKNILDAPVCTDCHGEHFILSPSDRSSSVAVQNIPKTCGACHEKEQIAVRYGFAGSRLSTYLQSYHGMANKLGEKKVANCISCHRYHDIYPSSDPRSSIYPANLSTTCGKCHPGATANLINAKVHVRVLKEDAKGAWYIRIFYTYFISILMILFLGYVFLDIYHRISKNRHTIKNEKDNV